MNSSITYLEAKAKIEALCANQEKCQYDIDKKLFDWGFDEDERNQLISHLISFNFINEERFTLAYVSGKFKLKKWGRLKIKNQLKLKKISDYSINKGLKEIDLDDYWSTIVTLSLKKANEISKKDENNWIKKGKIYRFLISKGYEHELINEAIYELDLK
jgi:regulatory protein